MFQIRLFLSICTISFLAMAKEWDLHQVMILIRQNVEKRNSSKNLHQNLMNIRDGWNEEHYDTLSSDLADE